ncbi:MAG: hypothetical protein ABI413_04785 [Ktedonobacteraceae bacterium]
MFYWSRWANITITGAEAGDAKTPRHSCQETGYQLKRETRPVVAIRKSNTQVMSTFAAHQQNQERGRAASSRIGLDVRRQTYARTSATCMLSSTGITPDAITETVLVK